MNRDLAEYIDILGFQERPYGASPTAVQAAKSVRVLFLAEGLGDDQSGLLNASPGAQLLGKMIDAMGLKRDEVHVGNSPASLQLAQTEIVVVLGEMPRLETSVATVTTFHPNLLLGKPELKRPVWEELQRVMATLGTKR